MNDERVSVIMATLNAERFLAESLASVATQSLSPHEIVVVDGGSSDATLDIANSFAGVRVLRQRTQGFAMAWNEGIQAARGSFIALLDSDDRWRPDKLRLQIDRMTHPPAVDAVLGHVRFFVTGDAPAHFRPELLEKAHPGHMPGALLARRDLFDRIGWFEDRWAIAGDVDWFARLIDSKAPVAMLEDVVLEKRVHSTNLSYTAARTPVVRREILGALRESIHRKRERGQL